jgi:hypothetical protein
METRHEACSAEGQPRNILDRDPNRFGGRCPALSCRCHRVIHSCSAFFAHFSPRGAPMRRENPQRRLNQDAPRDRLRVNGAAKSAARLHQSGTAAGELAAIFTISKPRHGLPARGESPLSGGAAF